MWSVIGSWAAFLLYFCVFREENDLDRELEESIFTRIPGMEEKSLIQCIRYNEEQGLSTKELKDRLKEIQDEKENTNVTSG